MGVIPTFASRMKSLIKLLKEHSLYPKEVCPFILVILLPFLRENGPPLAVKVTEAYILLIPVSCSATCIFILIKQPQISERFFNVIGTQDGTLRIIMQIV